MSERKDGGPAYPFTEYTLGNQHFGQILPVQHGGMTLREYFAGEAMKSLIIAATNDETRTMERFHRGGEIPRDSYARIAYEYADAMLKAREESQ